MKAFGYCNDRAADRFQVHQHSTIHGIPTAHLLRKNVQFLAVAAEFLSSLLRAR
jgi:hypothetical protein